MKILLINYRYFVSGGPERYLFNVKNLLEENGHQVISFSIKSDRNEKSEYEKYFVDPIGGQDVHYFHEGKKSIRYAIDTVARLFYSFHVRNKLSKLIENEQPDVAYILHHYNKLSPSVINSCKSHGVRVVMRLSDFFLLCPQAHFLRNGVICEECHQKSLLSCVKNKCIKDSRIGSLLKASALYFHKNILKIYDDVDKFVCTTDFMKKKLIQDGVNADRVSVIRTFVNSLGEETLDNLEGNYILYFGRFSHEKGVDILINAYYRSKLYDAGIRLMLVGGKLSDIKGVDAEILIKLGGHITTYDFLPTEKLEPLIKGCLFTVVPSRWYENLPNTILESYRLSKLVITSDIGSLPEVVENGSTGLLFKNENINDLSEKLRILVSDGNRRMQMRKEVTRKLATYSQDTHYQSLMNVLRGVI
ncbi:MAG: glycosyltransferase family 4 protein [Gammaproteobacteria bacterium]|nr:glycosyltransferase family 4 protein [Gammaproteobacteria bacterium]